MTIEQLRALLKAKSEGLTALKGKAFGEAATDEDMTALRTAMDEVQALEKKLDMAEEVEAMQAKHSLPANAPVGSPAPSAPAQPAVKMGLDQKLSLAVAAQVKAGRDGNPLKVLEDEGYGQFARELGGQKAVNTTTSSAGGVLVPTHLDGGIIPLLRNDTTFLSAGPMRVQLINGQFKQPRGATGATASYVAQGALKPVTEPTFDAIDMAAKKLAGIVPLTNEAAKWTVGNIEAYIRDDLVRSIATVLDLNAYLGTGTGNSPLGILNKVGVQTFVPTFATATTPTLAELDRFASGMVLKLTTANIGINGKWRWLMSHRTAMALADMRVGGTNGDLAFPEMSNTGGRKWKGIDVLVTNQIPTNGGTGTDETTVALIDFSHVLFGEEAGITVKVSDQATLVTGAGASVADLLSLWQQNMFAILAETEHDFGLRYAKAVVKATAIRF